MISVSVCGSLITETLHLTFHLPANKHAFYLLQIYKRTDKDYTQTSSVRDNVCRKNVLMFEVVLWYMTPKCHLISAAPYSDELIHLQSHLGQLNMHEWRTEHLAI